MVYIFLASFLICLLGVLIFQTIVFGVALLKRNNGVADISWGLGFIIISACSLFIHHTINSIEHTPPNPFLILLSILVTLWGLRLSIYLFIRNWSHTEDWRYAKWRQEWGKNFYVRSFFQVFVLQGLLMIIIGSPIILCAIYSDSGLKEYYTVSQYASAGVGMLLWLIGFFFESVGDHQLAQFKKDPANKGKVMRYGVWQYTRHPNYFGEASMWWGIFLLSCVSAHGVIDILLRAIGPATITFLLLRVSGVTMLESKYKGNKEYEDYQKRTSAFIPLPTKKGAV